MLPEVRRRGTFTLGRPEYVVFSDMGEFRRPGAAR